MAGQSSPVVRAIRRHHRFARGTHTISDRRAAAGGGTASSQHPTAASLPTARSLGAFALLRAGEPRVSPKPTGERPRRERIVVSAALAFAVAVGTAACTAPPTPSSSSASTARPELPSRPLIPGWHSDSATIVLGEGQTRVDVWFDPLCPYCKRFEQAQREALRSWSDSDASQLVLHPLTFLDRASQGTAYSTRAATVLATAAEQRRDAVLPILQDLYGRQPAEGSPGLSDAELLDIAAAHGVDARTTLAKRPYDKVLAAKSLEAFRGATPITGTPSVRVDGVTVPEAKLLRGSLADLR